MDNSLECDTEIEEILIIIEKAYAMLSIFIAVLSALDDSLSLPLCFEITQRIIHRGFSIPASLQPQFFDHLAKVLFTSNTGVRFE